MKSSRKNRWKREELIVAFNLYCRLPFGQINKTNPVIIDLARAIDRTPSALAMKLVNFSSFDPFHKARNVMGLQHASKADREVWNEFHANWEKLAIESQMLLTELQSAKKDNQKQLEEKLLRVQSRETETQGIRRVRLTCSRFFSRSSIDKLSIPMCIMQVISYRNAYRKSHYTLEY